MGQAITFAQQKGGAGKTTLLVHLAHAFALKKQQVGLLDLDPQNSLTHWASIADIDNLTMLETASYRIGSDLRSAKERYDLVLVDCPGSAAATLESAIRDSDLVLTPCQPSKMDVWATGPILDVCKAEDTEARIILNRVPPRSSAADDIAKDLAKSGTKVLKSRIGNRIAFSKSFGMGKTALGLTGQPQAKSEVEALRKEVAKLAKSL